MLISRQREYRVLLETDDELSQVMQFIEKVTSDSNSAAYLSCTTTGYTFNLRTLNRAIQHETFPGWLNRVAKNRMIYEIFEAAVTQNYDSVSFVKI